MDDCIFCKIVSGEIPSKKIYENEDVIAFLDINPKSKGHTLIVPKKHSENIFNIGADDLKKVIEAVQMLSITIQDKLTPEGMNIRQNNGEIAGQTVNHFHFHIVPKYSVEEDYDIEDVFNALKID